MATTDEKRSQLDHDLDLFARINEPDPPLGECLRAAGGALVVGIAVYLMGALIKAVPSPAPYDADVVAWGGFGILVLCDHLANTCSRGPTGRHVVERVRR